MRWIVQKLAIALVCCCGIVACGTSQKAVPVVKLEKDRTILGANQIKPQILFDNTPAGVTAICFDGSYSQATDSSTCVGNGGVKTRIDRYHAE